MKSRFLKLLQYNHWANKIFADKIIPEEGDSKILMLFSHILNAQCIWIERIKGGDYMNIKIWHVHTSHECLKLNEEVSENWMNFISSLEEEDFQKEITYTNTKNEKFVNTVEDILTHVINHSTYHRAQIAMIMRQEGTEPPSTDYIVYLRNQT